MRNYLTLTAATLVLAMAPGAHADATQSPAMREASRTQRGQIDEQVMRDKAQAALELMKTDDYQGAADGFAAVVSDGRFNAMPADFRFAVIDLEGAAERKLRHYDKAYALYQQAAAQFPDQTDADFWADFAGMALATQHDADGIDAMTRIVTDYPDALPDFGHEFVSAFTAAARRGNDIGRERKLLEALRAAKYAPNGPGETAEYMWFRLLTIYVDADEDDKAQALLADISEPDLILDLRIDSRFRSLIAGELKANPDRFDLVKAQAGALDRERAVYEAHPDRMTAANSLAHDLMQAGRLDDALKVVDETLARNAANPSSFTDADDTLNWIHDTRSGILARMGRWDEAVAAEIKARDVAKDLGDDLVSQYINLADLYYTMGQPQKTLDALKGLDDASSSPYGVMSADEARTCAYVQLNESEHLKQTLDYVRAHVDDGFAPYRSAMECAGDVDGLAKTVIARLDNAETRSETLEAVQTYLPLPHPTAIELRMAAVWTAVKARDDVKQAIARYGVIESVPTFAPTY